MGGGKMKVIAIVLLICLAWMTVDACVDGTRDGGGGQYRWDRVADKAAFPEGYNYPVFVFGKWMVALNNGAWLSANGEKWIKTDLPASGLNSGYQKYIQFDGAIYALGTMTGSYQDLRLTTQIKRTRDFTKWETLAEHSNLPQRVFYGAAVFKGKMWLAGGYDGRGYYDDVWNSADGVHWHRVTEHAGWSARNTKLVVFRDKIMLLGGGVIDGQTDPNPASDTEIWSSADGRAWTKMETNAPGKWAGTPVVYDKKLWLIGANRNDGNFSNALWVTGDGVNWQKRSAPWSPRGGVAVWEFADRLYLTGGKYSTTVNGEIRFIYSNDVWAMGKKTE
jgi:hypothetical protein